MAGAVAAVVIEYANCVRLSAVLSRFGHQGKADFPLLVGKQTSTFLPRRKAVMASV